MAILTAPSSLIAAFSDGPKVLLAWASNDVNATGFIIERTEFGEFSQIASVNSTDVTYVDINVKLNKSYYYRVRAFNIFGFYDDSGYSNVASATTSGIAITELQIPLGVLFTNILNEFSLFSIEAEVPLVEALPDFTKSIVLGKSGLLAVGTNTSFEPQIPANGTLVSWYLSVKTAAQGQSVIADLKLDGVSLWGTNLQNRPTIPANANKAVGTLFDTLSCTIGQVLTLDLIQVGTSTIADTVTCQLNYLVTI